MKTNVRSRMMRVLLWVQVPGVLATAALVLVRYQDLRNRQTEQLLLQASAIASAAERRVSEAQAQLCALARDLPQPASTAPALRDADASSSVAVQNGRAMQRGTPVTSAPQRWLESHEDARPTRTGLTAITDEHGDVVAMRPGERLGEPRLLLSLPRGLAGKNRGVYQAVTARGATLDVAYQRAPAAEWTALAGARRDDLVAAALAGVVPALLLLFAQVVALWPLARFGARLLAPKAPEWRAAAQPVSPQETQDLQSMLFSETEARQATIARELHDGVGSSLAGLSLLLGNAQLFTREPEAVALLAKSQEQLAKTARQVRQISRGMMPAGQDGGALLPALQQFAADMSTTRGLVCTFDSRGNFQQLSAHVGGQLFRIAQEATANAIRHGGASRVRITLARAGERCRLTVQDNGRGCKTPSCNEPGPGVGLRSMAARAHAIGGTFALRATRGAGVRVRVQWIAPPVPAHSSASRSS